jgi:hypothetical protein
MMLRDRHASKMLWGTAGPALARIICADTSFFRTMPSPMFERGTVYTGTDRAG